MGRTGKELDGMGAVVYEGEGKGWYGKEKWGKPNILCIAALNRRYISLRSYSVDLRHSEDYTKRLYVPNSAQQ